MKGFRITGTVIILFLITSLVQAHEFWMQPKKLRYAKGETMVLDFMVGENFEGELWSLKKERLVKFDHLAIGKQASVMGVTVPGEGKNLSFTFQQEGTQVFVMQSNNAFLKLDGEKFNAYLKEDGLDEILEHRTKTNTLTDSASEHYARCAKLLVQVGDKTDETYRKPVGLPLEIIPLSNPYSVKIGDEIKFRVLFQGKPLEFTLVKIWNKGAGKTFIQNLHTEKDGTVTARLSNSGSWMVSTVKMIPSKDPKADWQSYWSTLVFGL
jgi:uncharacterized GH25 family protein